MTRVPLVSMIVCVILGTFASNAAAESKSGAIKFTGVGKESVDVAMGDKLKLNVSFKQIKVGEISAVSVNGSVMNTATERIRYAYFVCFLDQEKNLIGCQHFGLGVDGGKKGMVGTFIELPPREIARIASYSVAFYESSNAIGK